MGCSDSHARDTPRGQRYAAAPLEPLEPGAAGRLTSKLTGTVRRGRGLMRHADWLRRFIGWLTLINFYPVLFAYNWRAPDSGVTFLSFSRFYLPGAVRFEKSTSTCHARFITRDYSRAREGTRKRKKEREGRTEGSVFSIGEQKPLVFSLMEASFATRV